MDCQTIMLSYANPDRDTQALHTALELAYQNEAELTVLHVNGQCEKQGCERHYLYTAEELAQHVAKANGYGIPVNYRVADSGNLVEATLAQAADFDVLVVADAHANCFEGQLNSSVADKLISPAQFETLQQAV